ncbi:MAG: polymer-forming cytoskeletal protein [Rhodobacteraceae bacterium]|nr:polymer-forming cytoskeletal protein [Paracoccaceae bacterium]
MPTIFSKGKGSENAKPAGAHSAPPPGTPSVPDGNARAPATTSPMPAAVPKAKPPASTLSSDLVVTGNLETTGDIQVEGKIKGDIRAHLLNVGEGATIEGEIVADDVVVNGRIIGRVRGLKVRLTSTARVEGDIIHKTIAIESGAHFEGSVQRQEDPLSSGGGKTAVTSGGTISAKKE